MIRNFKSENWSWTTNKKCLWNETENKFERKLKWIYVKIWMKLEIEPKWKRIWNHNQKRNGKSNQNELGEINEIENQNQIWSPYFDLKTSPIV